MIRIVSCRVLLAALLAGACVGTAAGGVRVAPKRPRAVIPATAPCSPTVERAAADSDGDGISDACEQYLAERYAPIVYHSSQESNYPTNVDWFLAKTSIWFYDDACTPDLHRFLESSPSQSDLLGRGYTGGCGATDTVHSDGTRSNHKQRTFYLADLDDRYRIGSLNSSDWTTYYHAYPNSIGGVNIEYWRFYAYNDAADNHGGDWESVQVVLNESLAVSMVDFPGHTDISYVSPSSFVWEGTHPRIFSEGGGHATRDSGGGIETVNCLGQPVPGVDPNNLCTFTRQETWTGGHVQWCKNTHVQVCNGAVTSGGRLVDLGEKTMPMNGQVFIKYSGIWGSPGTFYFDSGYWGPAFNETDMLGNGYITAWCYGMHRPAAVLAQECYPSSTSR